VAAAAAAAAASVGTHQTKNNSHPSFCEISALSSDFQAVQGLGEYFRPGTEHRVVLAIHDERHKCGAQAPTTRERYLFDVCIPPPDAAEVGTSSLRFDVPHAEQLFVQFTEFLMRLGTLRSIIGKPKASTKKQCGFRCYLLLNTCRAAV
jgi:hypothetical protein